MPPPDARERRPTRGPGAEKTTTTRSQDILRRVGYRAAHLRVAKARGPATAHTCLDCASPAAEWSYDHSDPDERTSDRGDYSLDADRYEPRCRPCHRRFDNACRPGLGQLSLWRGRRRGER